MVGKTISFCKIVTIKWLTRQQECDWKELHNRSVIERNYIKKKNYRKFVERKFKETLENSLLCRLGVGELDKKKVIPILAFWITKKVK